MKNKILFVNAILENRTPRSIRTLNFIKHLKNDYEIHVLYFKFNNTEIEIPGVTIHTIEIKNWFRRKFVASKTNNILFRFIYKLMDLQNKLKDVYYFDIFNLSKKIDQLIDKHGFDDIIISVFPFSLYKLVNKIPFDKVTFDIGDHLYKNSAVSAFSNSYYYELEKKVLLNSSKLIVTNSESKKFYIENYNIDTNKIKIVSQGFDEDFIEKLKIKGKFNRVDHNVIRLVYGGRFYKGLRDPMPLIRAIENYNQEDNKYKIQFDIYGGQGINIEDINGVTIYPSINQKMLFEEIYNSDYNVFIDNSKGIQTPGKIYENLAIGTPMLFVKSPYITKTYEVVKDCEGIAFVENQYNKIFDSLSEFTKEEGKIKCNFDLTERSWKNLATKIIQ